MEKSPELKKALEEDAEFKFFDLLGNALEVVDTYLALYERNSKREYLEKLQKAKVKFYKLLNEFRKSGFKPKRKINLDSLNKFDEFKALDWSIRENLEKVKRYFYSLKSEK